MGAGGKNLQDRKGAAVTAFVYFLNSARRCYLLRGFGFCVLGGVKVFIYISDMLGGVCFHVVTVSGGCYNILYQVNICRN